MGECFIVRKGGNGVVSELYAAIGVTYPSGSICTCTNGTIVLTSSNTNGQVVFSIPSNGTWTVNCTNGTKTATRDIDIAAEGQCEDIELMYEYVVLSASNGLASGLGLLGTYISPAIDVTNYSTLEITGCPTWSEYGNSIYVCLTSDPSSVSATNVPAKKAEFSIYEIEQTKTIDLSDVDGEMYLGFWWTNAYMTTELSVSGDKLNKLQVSHENATGAFTSIIFK